MADATLDTTGLNCPIPVLKARKALKDMAPGATLEVVSTDPGSVADFEAFCESGGHQLLKQSSKENVYRFLIRNAG